MESVGPGEVETKLDSASSSNFEHSLVREASSLVEEIPQASQAQKVVADFEFCTVCTDLPELSMCGEMGTCPETLWRYSHI